MHKLKLWLTFICCLLPFTARATLPVIDWAEIGKMMQELSDMTRQITIMQTQAQYLEEQLDAIKTLGPSQYRWEEIQGLMSQLGQITYQTNAMAYSAEDLGQKFQAAFPGYQPPQNFNQQYRDNVRTTLSTLNGVLQGMGTSANDFTAENSRLAFLQAQVASSHGQTQALQASAQIASMSVSQLELLRQTMVAQTNAQTVYFANKIQNQASSRAELGSVINAGSTKVPAYGTSGDPVHLPHF